MTELTFVPCWNFAIQIIDDYVSYKLKPFDHSKYSITEKELGTKRMGFLFDETKNPTNSKIKYVFKSATN